MYSVQVFLGTLQNATDVRSRFGIFLAGQFFGSFSRLDRSRKTELLVIGGAGLFTGRMPFCVPYQWWRHGVVVNTLVAVNKVTLHWVWLLLG